MRKNGETEFSKTNEKSIIGPLLGRPLRKLAYSYSQAKQDAMSWSKYIMDYREEEKENDTCFFRSQTKKKLSEQIQRAIKPNTKSY